MCGAGNHTQDARATANSLASKILRAIGAPAPFPGWD